MRRENMLWMRIPSKVYFKYGCIEEGLKDLRDDGVKKVFIVSDNFIWDMFGQKITHILEKYGLQIQMVEPTATCLLLG